MRVHRTSRRIAVLLIAAGIGCGGGSDTTTPPPPTPPVLTNVTLDVTTVALKTGETRQVQASPRDQNGGTMAASVAWSSSAAGVATVSPAGLITAVGPGTAVMTATATAGTATRSATVTVTVTPRVVTGVTVTPATLPLTVGATGNLTAAVAADAGVPVTVTWTSSSATVATVSTAGVVTALGVGTSQVCAVSTFDPTKQGCSAVTVSAAVVAVASVTVAPAQSPLVVGDAVQLAATTRDVGGATLTGRVVTWSSGTPSVATVSQAGLVTAVAAGTSTITATSEGRTGTATVTVTAPTPTVASVTVTPATPSINVGGTVQFNATVNGANNPPSGVTWTSADNTRVTVNATGLATGVAASGGTQVCARSTFDPTKFGCGTLVVTAAPAFPSSASVTMPGLSFDPPQVDIAVGGTVTFSFPALTHNVSFAAVTGAPANIPNTTNANVARTFTTAGTFNYQCTLHGGMSATVVVH